MIAGAHPRGVIRDSAQDNIFRAHADQYVRPLSQGCGRLDDRLADVDRRQDWR